MDTTTIITVSRTTLLTSIQQSLDALHWFLLMLGCFMYWLKTLNTKVQACKGKGISPAGIMRSWIEDNFIEIPTSVLTCVVIAVVATDIPTELIDLKGKLAVFIVGYSNSSILNSVITNLKPKILKQDPNNIPDSQGPTI